MTPTPSPRKKFSLGSSAGQPHPAVHFGNKVVASHPETIDPSPKQGLSSVTSHPPPPPPPPPSSDRHESPGRRQSIVLPLMTTSVPANVCQTSPISPRKRRFSTVSPPLHDSVHDSNSPRKRRFSSEDKNQYDLSSSFIRTQELFTIPPSTNKPPPQVCAEINQHIESTFHYPDFDFMQHVQHRSYVVRTQYFDESECISMLDTDVDSLLQRVFEKLPPRPDTSFNIDIKASHGKGLGMFSRKRISDGVTFLVEYPTVIAPYVIGLSVSLSTLYADIFKRLSGPIYGDLMNLSCSSGETEDVYESIMRINALAIELPVPGSEYSELNTHRAIFLQTSRCNHRWVKLSLLSRSSFNPYSKLQP